MAKTQILGTVSVVPMGDWNSTTTYQKGNYVRYNKATYMAKVANVNVTPGVSTNLQQIWMLCNYDGVAEIASETPLPDTANGAVGQSTAHAREDHQHKMSAIYESASAANTKWQTQEEVNDGLTEGVNEALSDIPLAPEQTGVAITGENTLNNAKVSVLVESKNLFDYNSKKFNGTTKIANGFRTTDYSCSEDPANNPYFKSGVSYTISYKSKTVGQGNNTALFGKVAIYNFTKGEFLYIPIESGTTFTIPDVDNGDIIGYVLYGSTIAPVYENYEEITNIQI